MILLNNEQNNERHLNYFNVSSEGEYTLSRNPSYYDDYECPKINVLSNNSVELLEIDNNSIGRTNLKKRNNIYCISLKL